jgi:hypothetical protein
MHTHAKPKPVACSVSRKRGIHEAQRGSVASKEDTPANDRDRDLAEDDHEVQTMLYAHVRGGSLAGGAMFLIHNPQQQSQWKKERNPRSLSREFPRGFSGPARRKLCPW